MKFSFDSCLLIVAFTDDNAFDVVAMVVWYLSQRLYQFELWAAVFGNTQI
jgi:hypothetical protein